jgi:hypothetical protein
MLGRWTRGGRGQGGPGDGTNGAHARMAAFRRPLLAGLVLALALVGVGAVSALAGGGAPTVELEKPSGLGRTGVVLNALVNPNGAAVSECYFEYGTSEGSLSSQAQCSYSPGAGETLVPVEAAVEGLAETTTYFYRIHANSAAGESSSTVREVTTLPTGPRANTEPSKVVGRTTATLNAFVTPNDSEVSECFFEYGTVASELDSRVNCSPEPGAGSEPVAVSATLTGLPESTVYYYRVVARNAYALEVGGRVKFETLPSVPNANTEPARSIGHTTATLKGFVTPNDALVEACYFEWGAHSIEENVAPCEPASLGSGEEPELVTAQLTGLRESETYSYRLVATNDRGTNVGGGMRFTTLPALPKALIKKPAELTAESALLRGSVNPEDAPITECTFEYGTTPAFGNSAKCNILPGAGESYVKVTASVSGLSPTTSYLVRLRARNVYGVVYSEKEPFTTFAAGKPPVVKKLKPTKGSSAGGTAVTIKGEFLSGATAVTFGETETTDITHDSPESITVISPPGVGTVDVSVTTANGESAISGADHFTYGGPTVKGVSPGSGSTAGGAEVTVTGSGFVPGTSGTTFVFGKAAATSVECSSSATCTMVSPPAYKGRTGVVQVRATVGGKKSHAETDYYSYTG